LEADVDVVNERDYEGLTPLLRLWVRYFVILGDDAIERVTGAADLTSNAELGEAWKKTELLLRCAHLGSLEGPADPQKGCHLPRNYIFRAVHASAAVDCPRPVVKIATILHPEQLVERDETGMTPLLIAAGAPIYEVHDLTDDGYELEDQIHGDDDDDFHYLAENEDGRRLGEESENSEHDEYSRPSNENDDDSDSATVPRAEVVADEPSSDGTSVRPTSSPNNNINNSHPSVIEILVQANPAAAMIPSRPANLLPLHYAVASGKQWNQGVQTILDIYPEAVSRIDTRTGLFPFLTAASVNEADCTTILELLLADPSLMDRQERDTKAQGLNKRINKKRKLNSDDDIRMAAR
jgi:hypothetical protein